MKIKQPLTVAIGIISVNLIFSFFLVAHAANLENQANLRIDEVTIPTSQYIQRRLLDNQGNYSKINLTVKPLQLGFSDGKGIVITDSIGNVVSIGINDEHEMSIWNNTFVSYYDSLKIKAGVEYDFILYVLPEGINVYFTNGTEIKNVMEYNVRLKPPFKYELGAQRTGAVFRDVVIKNLP